MLVFSLYPLDEIIRKFIISFEIYHFIRIIELIDLNKIYVGLRDKYPWIDKEKIHACAYVS